MAKQKQQPDSSAPALEINRVKIKGDVVEVDYTTHDPMGKVKTGITSTLPPHPDFKAAMNALDRDIAHICEVSLGKQTPVQVYQVSVTRTDDDTGYRLFAKRTLAKGPGTVNLNTPLRWLDHNDERQRLDSGAIGRVNRLLDEARKYALGEKLGEKAQQEMDFDDGNADDAAEAA